MLKNLTLVMPVYNEEECIVDVVHSWKSMLSGLSIDFIMLVINDGSCDKTAEALLAFEGDEHVKVVNKPNSGHGPTILSGYHKAVDMSEWVFQTDSDGEMGAEYFPELWAKCDSYDALIGIRSGRLQNTGRKLISSISRLAVKLLFGTGVADVNAPYRLMRSSLLKQIVCQIPDDTFAPNVIISGAFAKSGARILNSPVPHECRRTGSVSIVRWKLWKAAFKSLIQTLKCRPSISTGDAKGLIQ